jgi:DNA-binding Xre family transcriptional regulator
MVEMIINHKYHKNLLKRNLNAQQEAQSEIMMDQNLNQLIDHQQEQI